MSLGAALGKTVRHFFPELTQRMDGLRDGRDPRYITYSPAHVLWVGLMVFLLRLGSRRQLRFELRDEVAAKNLARLCGQELASVAHPDTVAYYLRLLPTGELEKLRYGMIRRLIRMKVLDQQRLEGAFLLAIDGTGQLTFAQEHCPHCLRRKSGETTLYYHSVLEAKLVTPSGLAFSLASCFMENLDPNASKQDCELKAFARLAAQIKQCFPQLRLCLLLDGLYANGSVMEICRQNGWWFIISFKEGSLPALWREYQNAKYQRPKNHHVLENPGQSRQSFQWASGLRHVDDQARQHSLNALECREERDGKTTCFAWLTNIPLRHRNQVVALANRGGRCRWKIENEGFNIQKNGGYALEHAYCNDPQAMKNWYLLLQIAHLLMQLLERGNLLGEVRKLYGSLRALARRLAESLRHELIPVEALQELSCRACQIRLSSA